MKARWLVSTLSALSLAIGMVTINVHAAKDGPKDRRHEGVTDVPDSTKDKDDDHGLRAHTNHEVHVRPDGGHGAPQVSVPTGETPQSLLPYYVPGYAVNANLGSGVIAIIDAFDYPTALADFNTFSKTFGLPQETSKTVTADSNKVFEVMYVNNKKPKADCGWAQEAALDIEWAHAVAPKAKIVLIEAASNSFDDLLKAVDLANSLQTSQNVQNMQVSMSWGGSEFSSETGYDFHFNNPTIAYLAASGDSGGKTIYPSTSPFVIAAGGTTLLGTSTSITGEAGWSGSGGGKSSIEGIPSYQLNVPSVASLVGSKRGTPDISFDADPATGVSVFDSTKCGSYVNWMVFGGTSVASPALAGIVNLNFASTHGNAVLPAIYGNYNSANYLGFFHDVTTGKAGSFLAKAGWDFVTGIGSNKALGWF